MSMSGFLHPLAYCSTAVCDAGINATLAVTGPLHGSSRCPLGIGSNRVALPPSQEPHVCVENSRSLIPSRPKCPIARLLRA